MKTAYFDCFSGVSGDMFVGALLDSGLDFQSLKNDLQRLGLSGYEISSRKIVKNGITGTKFDVCVEETHHHHRSITDIKRIFSESSLPENIKSECITIFEKIVFVEALIHSVEVEKIHLHEVGAVDSIVDITASVIGLNLLGIEKVISSSVNTGEGLVKSMHGLIPVPAPATAALLKGVPIYSNGIKCELTTPTGAVLISHFSGSFGSIPGISVESIGYGAGTRDLEIPNLMRVLIGEDASSHETAIPHHGH